MAQSGAGPAAELTSRSIPAMSNQCRRPPAGRPETKLDPLAGRRGIQRQPGGAALGDPRLGDQQIGPPRQVQADHRAALRPAGDQFACHGIAEERRVRHRLRSVRPRSRPDDRAGGGRWPAGYRRGIPRAADRGVKDLATTCRTRPGVKNESIIIHPDRHPDLPLPPRHVRIELFHVPW